MIDKRSRDHMLMEMGGQPYRRRSPFRVILANLNWEILLGFAILIGFFCWLLAQNQSRFTLPGTIGLVLVGWIFSLCLHEFGHAAAAVWCGDDSETTQRYLSFNPLHYVNLVYSVIFPIIFLFLGGIGLPGGAVYIRRDLIRGRWRQSVVSLAGPFGNLVVLVVIAALFHTSLYLQHPDLAAALAFLALLEAMAIIFNLLPVPPLDGFGVIAPFLSARVQMIAWRFGNYTMLAIFLIIWYLPLVGQGFYLVLYLILYAGGIDPSAAGNGYIAFTPWLQH